MERIVSVIMPTYNCGAYIKESVASVLSQTVSDWELIIIDDCSTDCTEEVLLPFLTDERIHYVKLTQNSGPAVARNEGLALAQGVYIAFLDSDDLWPPDKLEKQIAFMQETGARISCTGYEKISETGEMLGTQVMPFPKADYNRVLFSGNCLGNSTVMYERAPFSEVRVPPIRKRNDFALWLQILKKAKYAYGLQEPLMQYRVREASVSSNKSALLKYHWELYRDVEHLGVVKSAVAVLSCLAVKFVQKLKGEQQKASFKMESREETLS